MKWTLIAAILIAPKVAHADLDLVGGHGAYSIGGAALNGPGDGVRSALDAGVVFGWFEYAGGGGHFGAEKGPTIGAAVVSGFTTSPTFVAFEGGYAHDATLAGASLSGGPVLQLDPDTRLGLTLHATADFLFSQVGVRLTVIGADKPEVSIALTIGAGRF